MLVEFIYLLSYIVFVFEILVGSSGHFLQLLLNDNPLVFNLIQTSIVILHLFGSLLFHHQVFLHKNAAVQ